MSHSRIVVGVDGSDLSKTAVLQAAHFASSRGLTLHLLHAFAPDLPMLGFGAVADRSVVTEHGERLLREASARAHAAHSELTVTSALHDGYASQALVSASRSAALVVVGAAGHGLLSRTTMGAVAMQVLTHARCPVLVVGHETPAAPTPGGHVVVGVDRAPASLSAVRTAAREARLLGGSVEAVHAWQAHDADDPTLAGASTWQEYVATIEDQVRGALATTLEEDLSEVKCDVVVVRDDPVHALAERSDGASLLVVAARGSGGFAGLHLGSTAMRIVGASSCPVLVTR